MALHTPIVSYGGVLWPYYSSSCLPQDGDAVQCLLQGAFKIIINAISAQQLMFTMSLYVLFPN